VFVLVPVVILAISFLFGLILAEVEGWPITEGFYYVTSMLCGRGRAGGPFPFPVHY